jgi:putative nucleotidyltransferase with HDIG domain
MLDRRVELYAVCVALAALAIAVALIRTGYGLGPYAALVALCALAAVGEEGSVRLGARMWLSISLLPTLFAAVAFGPLSAMIVAGAAMAGEFRRDRLKWAVYTSSGSITGAVTGLVAASLVDSQGSDYGRVVVATVAGAVTAQVIDTGFAAIVARLRGVASAGDVARTYGPVIVASVPLYVPVVALLVFTYREVSPWTLPLFLVPALAAQRLFALYQDQRDLTENLSAANERLVRANLSFATALVATLEARDRYTAGHSAAVATYARDIAARMGLPADRQRLAHMCGLVHDIGKIGLPLGLLEKTGPLTLDERRQMQKHAAIGERILAKVDDYAEIASIVRHHHERVDGNGYPDGIAAEEIPLLSRILGVADAYDAMTSDRPYRDAMPSRVARLRLAQAVESQFDTSVVAAFEAILASSSETYRTGQLAHMSVRPLHVEEQALIRAV